MSEEQQQAAAPAANDTSTSWNLGDFAKGFSSPLTKNEDGTYNIAGALLTGAGTGLATWFLSRILGIKGGPSLGISILAGLAGAHGAFTKQGGLDFFSNPKGYLKDFMDNKRAQQVDPNGAADEEMRAQQEEMLNKQQQNIKTPQERFQQALQQNTQADALRNLTSGKTPVELTNIQNELAAKGNRPSGLSNLIPDSKDSALGQLSDEERKSIMNGKTVKPEIIQEVEDARNAALDRQSLGDPSTIRDIDWADGKLLANVINNEFNGFQGNTKVRANGTGPIDFRQALIEMENSGNPIAVTAVSKYKNALKLLEERARTAYQDSPEAQKARSEQRWHERAKALEKSWGDATPSVPNLSDILPQSQQTAESLTPGPSFFSRPRPPRIRSTDGNNVVQGGTHYRNGAGNIPEAPLSDVPMPQSVPQSRQPSKSVSFRPKARASFNSPSDVIPQSTAPAPKSIAKPIKLPPLPGIGQPPAGMTWADIIESHTGQSNPMPRGLR